jgi:hypothetical protein
MPVVSKLNLQKKKLFEKVKPNPLLLGSKINSVNAKNTTASASSYHPTDRNQLDAVDNFDFRIENENHSRLLNQETPQPKKFYVGN